MRWFVWLLILILVIGAAVYLIGYLARGSKTPTEKIMNIRPAAYSGSYYPSDPQVLSDQIGRFLAVVPEATASADLRVLVVPHAGIEYSGGVAAYGFKELMGRKFDRVILLGASHHTAFEGVAVDDSGIWQTPLGQVDLDTKFITKLVQGDTEMVRNREVHRDEQTLEVELIFLQKVLADFKIVPLLLGSENEPTLANLAAVLANNFDSKTLLVISSDLSHYPNQTNAQTIDQKTIEAIVSGDAEKLVRAVDESMSEGIENLVTCACGESAIRVGMTVAAKIGAKQIRLLKYANSGDVTGDQSRVVGYGAIGFYAKDSAGGSGEVLGSAEQMELLKVAKETLNSFVGEGKIPSFTNTNPKLDIRRGVFVTLQKNGQLRGCLGVFDPREPLWKTVIDRTVAAASQDPRFTPVVSDELDEIDIEISVLSSPRKIASSSEIKLGKHGVIVKQGSHGGVFLPQVATETGWDLETFLGQLCSQKAGLPSDCWKNSETELYAFTAQVFPQSPL